MALRNILLIWLYFMIIASPVLGQNKSGNIIIGKVDSTYSHILNEKRKFWIYLPKKALSDKTKKFPVLYLLDAEQNFHSVSGILYQLSEPLGNILPEMIVVGIMSTDRVRDFTPTANKDNPFFKNSGGSAQFTAFLRKELIPYIEEKYPAAPYRSIVGHSLGGLLAIDLLLESPELFNSYIAIDPTISWDNQMMVKKAEKVLKTKKLGNEKLYLTLANNMSYKLDTSSVRRDTSISTISIRSILKLTDLLKQDSISGLTWKYAHYKDDSHSSVPLISTYDGLRYIFDFYPAPSFYSLEGRRPSEVDSILTAHYLNVSKIHGYKVYPEEPVIKQLAYTFLDSEDYKNAFTCFNFNIRNHPKSYNALNRMGDYFNEVGDFVKAREYYSKALKLKDNTYSREKLKELFLK